MQTVETVALTKTFDSVRAVDGIDLAAREGEFLVLLGPSGCGKTTLLRMIAGLETPSSGQILINGQDVTGLPPRARDIAMVFQSYALYPHLTVFNNIAFPLRAQGAGKAAVHDKVTWAATMFGIQTLLDRKPRQLSGGERQRVALARTLMEDRPVVLMDEPFSALDAITRFQLQDLAAELLAGRTVLLVTHDPLEALRLGHRVQVLAGAPARLGAALEPPGAPPRDPGDPNVVAQHVELLKRLSAAAAEGMRS